MRQAIKKEEYLEKIIHDLKIPAMAQVCALESLIKTTESKFSSDELDLIKLTLNSCNDMRKLIDTISKVHKLNNQKLSLNYDKFKISELLYEVLNEVNIKIKYNQLNLEINIENDDFLNADKLHIKCVIENILSCSINNAFKNTVLQVKIFKHKNRRIFEVKSFAPCVDPSYLKEIFNNDKFSSSINTRPCIGLGLYLSKEIINAHFGNMIVKSSIDNINILGFSLPE